MLYKTIVLELLEQHPTLHARLTSSKCLLSTMNQLAVLLRDLHLATINQLRQREPQAAALQLESQALELALQQLAEALPAETDEPETFSLDEAMLFIRNRLPRG